MILRPKISKLEKEKEQAFSEQGVYLGEISPSRVPNRVFICLLNGILIFLASFGTVGATVSAFGLPFYFPVVCLSLLVISMYIAFIYYNKVTFYVGYILLFLIFTISIFSFYWYVNSGYQAFMNTIFEAYSDHFKLLTIREATEYITNRPLTITVTMIFVGYFLCILLNITISGYMNLIETFLITFPLLQIPLYINRLPQIGYLAILLSVYITVGILGRCGFYKMPSIKNIHKKFYCFKKKNHRHHTYSSDGPSMLTTGIYSLLLSTLFLFLTTGLFFSDFTPLRQSQLKTFTDEYVKTYIQTGIWGFFDRYSAIGGLNNGQLGGVSSVRPDYQVDLEVSFVPYTTETLYLKSYIGEYYTSGYFAPENPDLPSREFPDTIYAEYPVPMDRLARMRVEILDPLVKAQYLPYNTIGSKAFFSEEVTFAPGAEALEGSNPFETNADLSKENTDLIAENADFNEANADFIEAFEATSVAISDLTDGEEATGFEALYVPYETQISYETPLPPSPEYEDYVYKHYLQVPDMLRPVLNDFAAEAGLYDVVDKFSDLPTGTFASTEQQAQAERLSIASTLALYYAANFEYTMAPGSTPHYQEFVTYFLQSQRRGFCAHYAAASTLLMRSMGIPARYVEGYSLPLEAVSNGTLLDPGSTEWFEGTNAIPESSLVQVTLTDGQAHAWVEIYLDGYGWIPFEFTPPSSEEEQLLNLDFASIFASLMLTQQRDAATQAPTEMPTTNLSPGASGFRFQFEDSLGFLLKPLGILVAILIIVFGAIYYYPMLRHKKQLNAALKSQNFALAVQLEYQGFLQRYCRRNKKDGNLLPSRFLEVIWSIVVQENIQEKIPENIQKNLKENIKENIQENIKENMEKNIKGNKLKGIVHLKSNAKPENLHRLKQYLMPEYRKELVRIIETACFSNAAISKEEYVELHEFIQCCKSILRM